MLKYKKKFNCLEEFILDISYYIYMAIIYLFAFIFGASIGSFLNVCIYRLPKEESLIKKSSHCMSCGEKIKFYDLIPIISWFVLKGKCRNCKSKISIRYTIVELLNALCWVFIFWKFDITINPIYCILVALLFSALIVVFFMDFDTQLISTYVVIFIGLLAIPEYLFCRNFTHLTLKSHIIGFFAVSVFLLIIELASKGKAMGRGDVYLMAAAGLFLGTQNIILALMIGLIIGSIAGLIIKHKTENSIFAFGPWLALGIAISTLYGNDITKWYMSVTGLMEILA